MASEVKKHDQNPEHLEEVEQVQTIVADNESDSDHEEKQARPVETRMTKAKWLACIALCISYSTAFQQNAVTAAIAKHIDDELGIVQSSLSTRA